LFSANEQVATLTRIADETAVLSVETSDLVRFGNHTMHHPNLSALEVDEAVDEIHEAWQWLSTRLPRLCDPIVAYPYGLSPQQSSALLASTDMKFGLAVDGGWMKRGVEYDRSRIPRWNVPAGISRDGFLLRIRGRFAA
jgi:hypothetical protein